MELTKELVELIQTINSGDFQEADDHTIDVLKSFSKLLDNWETTKEVKEELNIIINDKNKITDCFK